MKLTQSKNEIFYENKIISSKILHIGIFLFGVALLYSCNSIYNRGDVKIYCAIQKTYNEECPDFSIFKDTQTFTNYDPAYALFQCVKRSDIEGFCNEQNIKDHTGFIAMMMKIDQIASIIKIKNGDPDMYQKVTGTNLDSIMTDMNRKMKRLDSLKKH